MPLADKEKRREYYKEYYKKHPEKFYQKKEGRKEKGAEIADGFNDEKLGSDLSRVEKKEIKKQVGEVGGSDAAYQMLEDMRWVYRTLRGRTKLKKLVKGDDRQFVFMVKELMKIESALLSAKIRKEGDVGGVGQQNFFVVLKGLEDEKKFEVLDKTVDMKQIQSAIDPNAELYEAEEEEIRHEPEAIVRVLDRVEAEDGD